MKAMKVVDEVAIAGKRVLVRGDLDVPLKEGKMADETRLDLLVPTLKYLLEHGVKQVVLIGHLGRPHSWNMEHGTWNNGEKGESQGLSLRVVKGPLGGLLGVEVGFVDWEEADRYFKNGGGMGMGRREKVLIWENLRFWKGEKGNDSGFAGELAALGEIYVNEAFAVSHREHASVVGVPRVMKEQGKPVVAGFHVAKEVEMLSRILENPKRPVVVILGGAKTETKLPVIEGLWKIADVFLLGGVVANTFLVIEDEHPKKLGQSVWDNHQTDEARKLWGFSKQFKFRFKGEGGREVELKRIVLPRDLVVAHWDGKDFYNQEEVESYHRVGEVFDQTKGIWELGERTASLFAEIVAQAGTVVWAGPLGYCEEERFCKSSQQVAEAMAGNAAAFKVAGGGDTEAMLTKFGVEEKFDWISSGGGAMMEFLADRGKLPGLTVLS